MKRLKFLTTALSLLLCAAATAADWPTYLADSSRSGVTKEQLELPLHLKWVYQPRHAPQPAWPAPAKRDIWNEVRELNPIVTYDRAFQAVSVGDAVYFGSSADDQVYCLDAATGGQRWSFFTEGPVRLAPTVASGRVYFGSDDGWIYCLNAADGALIWKQRPSEGDRRLPGNGRIISIAPARAGVIVDNGVAYFFEGIFPPDDSYRCAVDAAAGTVLWSQKCETVSPQGYMMASPTRLFVPQGRSTPAMFDRRTAKDLGQLDGPGGAYAVLVDNGVVSGSGRRRQNELEYAETASRESVAAFPGIRMIVNGDMTYLQSKQEISTLDRAKYVAISRERNKLQKPLADLKKKRDAALGKDQAEVARLAGEIKKCEQVIADFTKQMDACYLWKKPAGDPYSMILAGDVLFTGGENKVVAVATNDGHELWSTPVPGQAYGLCVANGRLLVSTTDGTISCFTPGSAEPEHVVKAAVNEKPYPDDALSRVYARAAELILKQADVKKGYCLVLGCGEGRLAYELAKRSDLHIVGVERDPAKIAVARAALDSAGLYGPRIAIHQWDKDILPYTSYMANLIVSEEALVSGKISEDAKEIMRVLKPCGGVACIGQSAIAAGQCTRLDPALLENWAKDIDPAQVKIEKKHGAWAIIKHGPVPGGGEWTQLYANANHTACSMDQIRGPMAIQWFGNPGPRDIIDRHHRPMSPLYKDGRLFVPADNLVITVDAYNGSPLWQLPVPDSRRVGALKSGGQMLLADDCLYVAAKNECWRVDVATGKHEATIDAPQLGAAKDDWGYLNCVDDILIGTGQKAGASFTELSKNTVNTIEGDFRPVIVGEYLFALNRHTDKRLWAYQGGIIMNNAICVLDGRIYFVESRNEKAKANPNGRLRIDWFCQSDTYFIALDLKTGKKVWERPITLPFQHIMFLNGADNTLVLTGTYNKGAEVWYGLFGFDSATGNDKWNTGYRALNNRGTEFAETQGSHGEQWQHPVLISGIVYSRPFAFDLQTGEKKDYVAYRGGHGCGGLTGSAYYLYGRGATPRMYPTETQSTEGIPLTLVSRPGCWLNTIPAGGLVLIPESSSGCTCDYPVQTSLALIPKSVASSTNASKF